MWASLLDKAPICGLCDRPIIGLGMVGDRYYCHDESRDCYHRITVYNGRGPSYPVGAETRPVLKQQG